jgi:hypothetical protein
MKQLNEKAMLVRLAISKPTTVRRDTSAEAFTQAQLSDQGLRVSAVLFKEPSSPVRQLLNNANAIYHYHRTNTLPYVDRGPRLLPVSHYDTYSQEVRKMRAELDSRLQTTMPHYDTYVQDDMTLRGARAALKDSPTKDEFERGFDLRFTFSPLPDSSHFLFDVSEEDKAALDAQLEEVATAARQEMFDRIREPLSKMVEKLKIPAGEPGSIFRDSLVENLHENVKLVRTLAMGDPTILAICDEVDTATTGHARNPQVLRESPIVRMQAAARLAEVEKRLGFMFAGSEA